MLKAGVSIIDISPKEGVQLAGYPHQTRENIGIHNPIYASVLYLENSGEKIVFVNTELLYFGKKFVKELRAEYGMNMVFTATHTHCAPWSSELLASELADGFTLNDDYIAFLMKSVRTAINEALANTFDAEFGYNTVKCGASMGIGGNRHDPKGLCDDNLGVLAVRDMKGTVRYIMNTYALHPTLLHEDNLYVTGDYPSYIRRFLKFAFPEAHYGFVQGCSGDQSTRYFRVGQDFEEAARVGTTIGVEIYHAIEGMTFSSDVAINYASKEIELPLKNFPPLEEAERRLALAEADFNSKKDADFLTRWNSELRLFGAQSTRAFSILASKNYKSPELPYEIDHIMIGDLNILTAQGELFTEIGLKVKSNFPEGKAFFFAVTNGTAPGYVYNQEAVEEGGYEYGNSMFGETAHLIVVDEFKNLIKGE